MEHYFTTLLERDHVFCVYFTMCQILRYGHSILKVFINIYINPENIILEIDTNDKLMTSHDYAITKCYFTQELFCFENNGYFLRCCYIKFKVIFTCSQSHFSAKREYVVTMVNQTRKNKKYGISWILRDLITPSVDIGITRPANDKHCSKL